MFKRPGGGLFSTDTLSLISLPARLVVLLVYGAMAPGTAVAEDQWDGQAYQVTGPNGRFGDALRPTIGFDGPGQVSGFTGCNRFSASVTINGSTMVFGAARVTRMACKEPAMATETQFLELLSTVRTFKRDGAEINLIDADGRIIMRLASTP